MDYKLQFGNKILYYRKKLNLTQVQLATRVGVQRITILRIENGECFPQGDLLFKLATVLQVEPVHLFDFKNEIGYPKCS